MPWVVDLPFPGKGVPRLAHKKRPPPRYPDDDREHPVEGEEEEEEESSSSSESSELPLVGEEIPVEVKVAPLPSRFDVLMVQGDELRAENCRSLGNWVHGFL